ncbi:MAG: YdeI/OmpD-associated family protein [Flavobacteriales bacterium]|nr:YdeI/OmpD-associated family protein [Flavobacteriales bacterium]
MKPSPHIDRYIHEAQTFARPILLHLRHLVHQAIPDVTETIKWGMPAFEYKGPLFTMAAFKQHAVFGFHKAELLKDPKKYLDRNKAQGGAAMGNGGRITSMKDLPPDDVLLRFLIQAAELNEKGIKLPPKAKAEKTEIKVADELRAALAKNKQAAINFEKLSPSHQREYLVYVAEAKQEATRHRRAAKMVALLLQGHSLNGKYGK